MNTGNKSVEGLIIPALVLNDYPNAHYATWVKEGKKLFETRTRMFSYSGDLVICCGKNSVTKSAGQAICLVHFGEGRPMNDEDAEAACIENTVGRIVYPLTDLRHFNYNFQFTDYAVKKNYQGIFSVMIPSYVKILPATQKEFEQQTNQNK